MGIKDLFKSLRDNHPVVFENVPISEFRGRRIAIDAGAWMYPRRVTCKVRVAMRTNVLTEEIDEEEVDNLWVRRIRSDIMMLTEHGITVVVLFDGDAPAAKSHTREKRRKEHEKRETRIRDLREKLRHMDRFSVNDGELHELKRLMGQTGGIPDGSYLKVKTLLRNLGIKCYTGVDGIEAERLACSLVRCGICCAVFSTDSDCLVHLHGYGAMIRDFGEDRSVLEYKDSNGFERYKSIPTFDIVRTGLVLEKLQMSPQKFTELCIMCGCDYNNNIPRLAIGGLLKHFRYYDSIDEIPLTPKQREFFHLLNHIECRQLFQPLDFLSMIDVKELESDFGMSVSQITNHIAFDTYIFDEISLATYMNEKGMGDFFEEYMKHISLLENPANDAVSGMLLNTILTPQKKKEESILY